MQDIDVVVAGAGAAGMMTALAAAQAGARVALLERDLAAPTTLSVSGGLIAAAGTRWQAAVGEADSPEAFAADVRAKSGAAVDPVLLATVTQGAAAAVAFLADVAGLPLHLHTTSRWPGHSAMRLHATPAESGAELQALLRAAVAAQAGIALRDGVRVTGLLPGQRGVTTAAGPVPARAVVLATGGFGGAAPMLARFCPEAAAAVHVGGVHCDGAGISWAAALGAGLLCMDSYQGQPHVSPHRWNGVRPRFGASLPSLGAVLVNRQGRRFVAEDMGPSELTAHLLAQPGGVAVEVWGAAAQQAALAGGPFRRAVELGAVACCADLPALAARFGLPAAALAETLAGHGALPDPFGRQRWGGTLAPPFFAAEVTGALAHTQGGVRVDAQARVLREDGTPIPHLFAAGGVACGISGHGAAGYVPGNGLAQSFALGLRAGQAAAG
ncbi:FAD-dependent oxidoreductase [Falsiroseomonas selenitidurans]|uniref:FAD-dependent oxidoreductase n=1 Tax=Falsiroseomonas selenitidurans TaxID=2716335 RepID=A0ABX1E5K5_9PROT|nr:FAD-dependent oxidoreductase [Falsiroseomonas selenitidurans]NKC30802.1 FAD-dependent oxidoreductase [Falsiroseomonas selenitidurans]